jgi:predicted DNA-binding protein
MGINGGRNQRGIEGDPSEEGLYLRVNISMPPSLMKRLDKFMKDQDRPRSWCIQKAVDEWLQKQDY